MYVKHTTENGSPVNDNNPLPMKLTGRKVQEVQTHNAVSVAANGSSSSAWIDVNGYDKVGICVQNSAVNNFKLYVQWSTNAGSIHGEEVNVATAIASQSALAAEVGVKARYCRIVVLNTDTTNARTMSSWIYLKI